MCVCVCVYTRLMGLQMADSICTRTLINNITVYLTGSVNKNVSVVKSNSDNLLRNGELYFLLNFKAWKAYCQNDNVSSDKCTTILHYVLHKQGTETDGKSLPEIARVVFQQLVEVSAEWQININKCALEKERVCLFLNRVPVIKNAVIAAIEHGASFGQCEPTNRLFHIQVSEDKESELTTARLQLLKDATDKLLRLNGCQLSKGKAASKFLLTTKSEGPVEEEYTKHICAVVKNSKSNSKETCLSWDEHIKKKIENLKELNEDKLFEIEHQDINVNCFLKDIATAVAAFELLSIKPSHSVFIGHDVAPDRNVTNTKGASFILYNTARIATILAKYNNESLKGEYPDLPSISDIDFSILNKEEEWELVYNFIVGYPQVLRDCIKYDGTFQTSPQVLCIFLSKLCQRFSVYYRKTRILTERYDHLLPRMFARLYMVKALQVVLKNGLGLFGIKPMSQM